jgi:hypothetical protein
MKGSATSMISATASRRGLLIANITIATASRTTTVARSDTGEDFSWRIYTMGAPSTAGSGLPADEACYIPGAGWHGFDPTNNKLAGNEHIAVAVAREQERASPLSGTWDGPANAFQDMNVWVQVSAI